MKFFIPIILMLGISRIVFGKRIQSKRSSNEDKVFYQELRNMNFSCSSWDSCLKARAEDPPVPEDGVKCSCHRECWKYGTCCIDSPYSGKLPIQKCVYTTDGAFFMVHRCPDNTHRDSIWRNHCESELHWAEEIEDILKITPVTSLDTAITYKNYYCFRCHEQTNEYVSWDLEVRSHSNRPDGTTVHSVAYDKTRFTWVAISDESRDSFPVILGFRIPDNVQAKPMTCNNYSSITSQCLFMGDEGSIAKCLSYSAVVYRGNTPYKNVHCALCNLEKLSELTCTERATGGGGGGAGGYGGEEGERGFACIFSRADKCFKGKVQSKTCKGVNEIWSVPLQNCTQLTCPNKLVLKGENCVAA